VPVSAATHAATIPATGWTAVASSVVIVGPMMKTSSSLIASTANAVSSSFRSSTTWDQRARTAAPTLGIAAPAIPAKTCGHGVGHCRSTAATTRSSASTEMVTAIPRILWPRRSTRRASGTATSALTMMYVADRAPAWA
jgi:hypothetical protein